MRTLFAAFAIALVSQAPAGMLAAQAPPPQVVSVALSSFKFAPAELRLRQGQAYRLHLINTSGGGHDFAAPEFFAASSIAAGDRGLVVNGKVKLAGKHSVDIALTPGKAGTYPLRCTHFLHSSMGMSGRIIVE